ncbi:tryptophan-rich sensory protein [Novosphingobium sp. FSY-8]|uniref:Tryptophan-rich sensory protein n=1 Tax=Novosphingobium ovatum TaxID=1908523 RepID=A0ABW9X9D1_9SPHN|nr:TspO/MBR family protein [Novosphingobium ovatum]NBC35138.1 tryptophan-rich sensory protein [Novosphingobium ovatum]
MTEIASSWQLRMGFARWALVTVPGVMLLGFLSGRLAGSAADNPWFAALVKPALYPPPIVFPLVWSVLYLMMGVALAIVIAARAAPGRGLAVMLFITQLLLNLVWSPLFFGGHQIGASLSLLLAIAVGIAATMALFGRVRPVAAWLMAPYLAWVLFAGVLTWQLLVLNPGADGLATSSVVARMKL